jgi:hypothetical protein
MVAAAGAWGQEYRIGQPTEPVSAPVYLTQPVEGRVAVENLPDVQDVRLVGGAAEPLEVRGVVGVQAQQPLSVEVMNLPELPAQMEVQGTVRVDDERPLRVLVTNAAPGAAAEADERAFAAFAARGAFSAKETRVRQTIRPPEGRIFHLSDLTLDARSDAVLKVRVLAAGNAIVGTVSGGGAEALPLAVLDSRHGASLRLGTPVPLGGEFAVEVESLGPGQGAPFLVLAQGYLSGK